MVRSVAIIVVCFALALVFVTNMAKPWDFIATVLVIILIALHRNEALYAERKHRAANHPSDQVLPPL